MNDGILIWGAGAIGGVAAAFLQRAGVDVTLVDADPVHVAAINAQGLAISGPVAEFVSPIKAKLPQDVAGTWRRIFLAVKAQHTEAACKMLLPHLAADGYVLSLQNGLCPDLVAAQVGRERTLGGCVNFAGDMLGPGQIRFGMHGALYIGEIDGGRTTRLEDLLKTLLLFEPETEIAADIAACLWGKMCFTVLLIAQAVGQASIVDCLSREELLPLWRRLVGEVIAIAAADGVAPRAFDGIDPDAFRPDRSMEAARECIRQIVAHNRRGAKTHSGYWRDIAVRKRRSEAGFQLQPMIDAARRARVACLALDGLKTLLEEVESGRRPQADDNLLALPAPAL